MSIEDEVRTGLAGAWDRFAGPGQSPVEQAGTLVAVGIGALSGGRGTGGWRRLLMRGMAIDLLGGAWVNNTPACVRWYERPGQGFGEHVGFAALHLAHVGTIGYLDVSARHRTAGAARRWALAHYGWMLAAAATVAAVPRRQRLPIAAGASVAGVAVDRLLGASTVAPWFAPVFYVKLLVGHAAGSIWNRGHR